MSVKVETLEKNMAKLTVEVSAEEFEKALQAAYNKSKSKISVPGFRKGKVPRRKSKSYRLKKEKNLSLLQKLL